MAVFLVNVCKFNGCEKIFPSLTDLIHHIENTHIDDSQAPEVTEKTQPTCLPLSYVLRFVTDNTRRDGVLGSPVAVTPNGADRNNPALVPANGTGLRLTTAAASINQTADHHQHGVAGTATATTNSSPIANGGSGGGVATPPTTNGCSTDQNGGSVVPSGGGVGGAGLEQAKNHLNQTVGTTDLKRKIAIKHHSYSISATNRSTTPTGSEMDDDEMMVSESEDSNDSWTTEEFSSEFIMRYGSRRHSASGSGSGINSSNEKPFACPVPGCKKRYKNVNGIKYHSKNGHKKDGNRVRKAFKCYCGKSYKTAQRLKNHNLVVHATTTRNGSPVDGTNLQAAVPLTSPALPSATLISAPVKSPPLTNGASTNTVVVSSTSSSSSSSNNSSIVTAAAAAAAIASSQIGTNATTTNTTCTSPSTLTITQVTQNKVPRALVLATAAAAANNSAAATPPMATTTTVASPVIPTANLFPVSPTASTITATSANVSPVNIKYDNLGILTPATSPKLIAANLCQEANQLQPSTVVSSTGGGVGGGNTNPATSTIASVAITLKSVTGTNGGGTGGGGGGNGGSNTPSELVSAGGNVGIALVVSTAVAGNETKLNTTTGGGNNSKNAVLSASVTAGQLYAEET
ncbi:uncharacterized protein LOC126556517 [Anopheles maculipalpis]|uniref:uncharacterized protein LOC126556517 n=1 Tax=Anopheles maculipalpis TaxID=1496333 RepID=UPI002159570D|nr:uncharacterized protein LOC126556517 [Anopheles maculipalpis]